jgi:tetratricopeptide (TPR) repeat protein
VPAPALEDAIWQPEPPVVSEVADEVIEVTEVTEVAEVTEAVAAAPPTIDIAPDIPAVDEASILESTAAAVESCFELYQNGRFAEVVSMAGEALGSDASAARRPADAHETAALWSVLALAHQALGDHAAARGALESAIEAAPEADRATYQRQLAALALAVAQALIASSAGQAAPESEARVTDLRDALDWLDRGREAAPTDAALRALTASTEALLWPAYEQVVMALVQRQEYRAARRLLRDALAHPRLPAARADTFRELFSGTFSGEIGQLTAQAIRSMQEARESEALSALQRAEGLIESIHAEALPPKRREEVDRRLWWGYNKLGVRRVEAGQFEDALDPLFHALRMAGSAPDRQAETRAALVRAFEGYADARALAIREVADGGDREAALVQSDKLWTRLKGALEQGLSAEDLAGALARVQRLFERIGRERP